MVCSNCCILTCSALLLISTIVTVIIPLSTIDLKKVSEDKVYNSALIFGFEVLIALLGCATAILGFFVSLRKYKWYRIALPTLSFTNLAFVIFIIFMCFAWRDPFILAKGYWKRAYEENDVESMLFIKTLEISYLCCGYDEESKAAYNETCSILLPTCKSTFIEFLGLALILMGVAYCFTAIFCIIMAISSCLACRDPENNFQSETIGTNLI